MWAMIAMGVLSGIGAYGANKIARKNAQMAESQAQTNALLSEANLKRRTGYRNEELGQQVWNIGDQIRTFMGQQSANMAAMGFDISTGDQRILNDTLRRGLEKISGLDRTYYLQQFEDELQTQNDILQYNFDAYSQRQIAKQYSGKLGAARAGMAAGIGALGAYQPIGDKSKINSNTGAGTNWMQTGNYLAQSGYGKLSLGSQRNASSFLKF